MSAASDLVAPSDFIRPDGSYDVTPLNLGDRDHVAAINAYKRGLRQGTDPRPARNPEPSR